MNKTLNYIGALVVGMASFACTDYSGHVAYNEQYPLPEGKKLYRPLEFSGQDWIHSLTVMTAWLARRIWPSFGKKDLGMICQILPSWMAMTCMSTWRI